MTADAPPMEPEETEAPHGATACGAKKKQGGGTCKKEAGWGTPHPGIGRCRLHGGNSPSAIRAAQKIMAEQEALRLSPGFERDEDPAEVLLAMLRASRARAAYWEHGFAGGTMRMDVVVFGGERKPSVEALFWQQDMDRSQAIATTCLRLGLEERRVRVAENLGDAMFAAIEAGLSAVGIALDTDQGRQAFEAAAARWERALGPGEGK